MSVSSPLVYIVPQLVPRVSNALYDGGIKNRGALSASRFFMFDVTMVYIVNLRFECFYEN